MCLYFVNLLNFFLKNEHEILIETSLRVTNKQANKKQQPIHRKNIISSNPELGLIHFPCVKLNFIQICLCVASLLSHTMSNTKVHSETELPQEYLFHSNEMGYGVFCVFCCVCECARGTAGRNAFFYKFHFCIRVYLGIYSHSIIIMSQNLKWFVNKVAKSPEHPIQFIV